MTTGPGLRRTLRETALTGGAATGVICLLAAVASFVFGITPLIFRSGSMSPAIGTGALGLARQVPVESLEVGDVVSVVNSGGTRITHRVMMITPGHHGSSLILQSDANALPDADAYVVSRADLVFFHVEQVGYLVSWLGSPVAVFLGGVLVGGLMMMAYGTRNPRPSPRRGPPDDTTANTEGAGGTSPPPRRAMAGPGGPPTLCQWIRPAALLVLPAALLTGGTVRDTQATFTDTAAAASGAFRTSARVAAPTLNCGELGFLSVRFTWTAVAGATGYDLIRTPTGGTATTYPQPAGTTSATFGGVLSSGTAVIRAKVAYPQTVWYSDLSNQRSYRVAAISTCS